MVEFPQFGDHSGEIVIGVQEVALIFFAEDGFGDGDADGVGEDHPLVQACGYFFVDHLFQFFRLAHDSNFSSFGKTHAVAIQILFGDELYSHGAILTIDVDALEA